MKKILYKNPEGGVCIVCPVEKDKLYPQLLAKHKREHEKAEKAKRKDLEAQAAQWHLDNPVPEGESQKELPEELVYVRTECPEFVFGEAEYEAHVRERSLKGDEEGVRDLDDADLPKDRVFRNAWCDDLPDSKVNTDMKLACELACEHLRGRRNAKLKETDGEYMKLTETGEDADRLLKLKDYRQKLRDATETLKALDVAGKYDDEAMLDLMRGECEKALDEDKL